MLLLLYTLPLQYSNVFVFEVFMQFTIKMLHFENIQRVLVVFCAETAIHGNCTLINACELQLIRRCQDMLEESLFWGLMSVFVKLNYQIIPVLEKVRPGSLLLFDLIGRKFVQWLSSWIIKWRLKAPPVLASSGQAALIFRFSTKNKTENMTRQDKTTAFAHLFYRLLDYIVLNNHYIRAYTMDFKRFKWQINAIF